MDSDAQALVNTVNTVGVMGKGIALQFKNQFPNNYKIYAKACKNNEFHIGELLVTEEESLLGGKKIIINFPTKTDWRKPSEYSYIEKGMIELVNVIKDRNIKSIAIPPLGAGNGGLDWDKVSRLMKYYLKDVDSEITIFQPNDAIEEVLKKERVKLTPARAMLLSVLFELVRNGEFVSEFAAEKIAYFLQKFGAKDNFKLEFSANFYGPYSGKVKHVLYYLNGSYITGYSSKDKKPFEEIALRANTENEIIDFLNLPENKKYKEIAENTKSFLNGFYSSFGLELLSTIDFIIENKKTKSEETIIQHLEQWSERKKTFSKFINIAMKNFEKHNIHC
ncbi:macro domain-containing protein [Flavobacterium sp. S87F.05.LMB.W.Kidney.N]|uniref:type II toxin-antitoxin system antitoxin DNA ADP-ribosyl glycohydrolase DarG n=1 Tax=Flavobacterium sp. S87F.05.LMB.W.Kidney.N TaxID=1278758 RepID=UPI001FB8C52B|nr:macro domain-containing protein [Flavobacterium sp. S87F.05.LMB.W.Kidney.N]